MAVEGSETDDKRRGGLSAAKRAASSAERTGANPPGNWPIPIDRDAVNEAIIEINRAGMFVCDRSYRIWEVDGAFLDMEGLGREDVIGRSIEEVLGPRVFALRKPFFDDAFEGRPSRIRVAGIRSHTRNKLLDVYFQPVLTADGEVACVISAARDISHFQAMNERLSLHEEIVAQTQSLALPLQGKSVVHVNSTREGGGVAEILSWLVPLMNELGLKLGDPIFE